MEPVLARFGLGDPEWLDPATSAVIVLIAFAVAFLLHKLIFPLVMRFTQWTPTDLDSRLVKSARWPITLGIVVLGVYLALTIPLDLTSSEQNVVDNVAGLWASCSEYFLPSAYFPARSTGTWPIWPHAPVTWSTCAYSRCCGGWES